MPTWRQNNPDFLNNIELDWNKLDEYLAEKNYLFILKAHPLTKTPRLEGMKNIVVLNPKFDIYPVIPLTSILITDYSSIYFDYLLCPQKGIILFPFDYNHYLKNNNGLAGDYTTHMPGPRVYDLSELLDAINSFTTRKNNCQLATMNQVKNI